MPRQNARDIKRAELRDTLWPGSDGWIWSARNSKGFVAIPRLLPLILHLIKILSAKSRTGDPSNAYLDLWCRDFGQGIIAITDEEQCAYSSGYSSNRGYRTWKEHMRRLVELRFLSVKKQGSREFGQVLILNPLRVCVWHHEHGRAPEEWWTAFVTRSSEIKADLGHPMFPEDDPKLAHHRVD